MLIQTKKLTAAEFRALPETTTPTELLDGELIVSPSPLADHQRSVLRTATYLQQHIPHGEILIAPMDIQIDEANIVQPDIFWRAENSLCREVDGHFVGAPDMIVKVISSGSVYRDRHAKYLLYEKHGVREYWLIDLLYRLLEIYHLVEGRYERVGVFAVGDAVQSPLLGAIELHALFPPQTPETLTRDEA